MLKNTLIIVLLLLVIYLYYQNKKPNLLTGNSSDSLELSNFKAKLGDKTLDELIEENEDYETEVDTLTRTKNSLEQDLLSQSNAFQNRLREKDREIKKLKENLTSEKQQHKGSLERITKLTEQITNLEQELKKTTQLTDFWNWLQENKAHQAGLKDWESVINFLKNQQRNYHLVGGNWSEGWTKSNQDYFKVFQKWLKSKASPNK